MLSKSKVKYIQSLHHKKFRDQEGAFIAEGGKVVLELLQSQQFVCTNIIGEQEWLHDNEILIRKHFTGDIEVVKDFELQKASALSTASQVLAVFTKMPAKEVVVKGRVTLLLDTIQDPGNLGTIIRIADWFGIAAIICSADTADQYNPKVVQSTMGSLARVNLVYTDLEKWIAANKTIKIYAAALNGKNIDTLKGLKEGFIVIGNESKGISAAVMQLATEKITILKTGSAESLNAAVATGIILSHL
ncbi:MAG TPA: RNA methyltransferase [Ferruginibacter sp.]|nr:RNA methyltransferase [Ferruginibacter sp.]